MIWKIKNKDVRISALWALISIPISFIGVLLAWGIVHSGGILYLPFIPAVLVLALLDSFKELPEWLFLTVALLAQYLGYFLFIYLSLKILRILKKTREENIAKEQSEKGSPPTSP